jgi:signal transduction histidine kinase
VTPAPDRKRGGFSFRTKLTLAMMLVISAITGLGLYLAQRNVTADAARDLQNDFARDLAVLHRAEEVRQEALAERCRSLVMKPRIHAALEDGALDLLYPSAKDELRDVMNPADESGGVVPSATFYRFLDNKGAVIPPPNPSEVGELAPADEAQLALDRLPATQQIGYVSRTEGRRAKTIDEVFAMPISSTETGDVIAVLAVGFKPFELARPRGESGIKSGIWVDGLLHIAGISASGQATLGDEISRAVHASNGSENRFAVSIDRMPHLLFYKRLNPDSLFPAAFEVCVYPLADALARQRRLQLQILGGGAALLVCGLIASQLVASRLSRPVERLAVESEANRTGRQRAEEVLASTSEELERSARFSADASHQLKSPVTVLRVGLESLLTRQDFQEEVYDELSSLLHQTYRLTGVIDDLLLLSRMDAGNLRIDFGSVNLSRVVEEWLDDLSALPDSLDIDVETELPSDLQIAGERRYASLIVQNLLENARKYNRAGGRIRVAAREEGNSVILTVGNTGRAIPQSAQAHIFERFHRGTAAENVPGHGLGLNLARQLARLHGGDLRLAHSDADWTEFEVRFRLAHQMQPSGVPVA